MAVLAADLIEPKGRIAPSLFPGESNLSPRLSEYIAEAVAKGSPSDDATKAWSYHRAFFAVYVRITGNPHQVDVTDEGGHKYDKEQAERFLALANHFLEEWEAAIDALPIQVVTPSAGIPTRFVW